MTTTNRLQKNKKLSRNRFFYDSNNSLVLFQLPNISLSIWIVCTIATKFVSGTAQNILGIIATLGLTIWALLELTSGVNYFRCLLGLFMLTYIILTRLF